MHHKKLSHKFLDIRGTEVIRSRWADNFIKVKHKHETYKNSWFRVSASRGDGKLTERGWRRAIIAAKFPNNLETSVITVQDKFLCPRRWQRFYSGIELWFPVLFARGKLLQLLWLGGLANIENAVTPDAVRNLFEDWTMTLFLLCLSHVRDVGIQLNILHSL